MQDPKELAVREIHQQRAAVLADKLKDPAAAMAADRAAASAGCPSCAPAAPP